jgi:hypothetical protein
MVAGSFDKFSSVTDIRFELMNLPPNNHVPINCMGLYSPEEHCHFHFGVWPSCIQIFYTLYIPISSNWFLKLFLFIYEGFL